MLEIVSLCLLCCVFVGNRYSVPDPHVLFVLVSLSMGLSIILASQCAMWSL